MKFQKVKVFFSFFLVLSIIYIFFVHTGLMAINNSVGDNYRSPDQEINFTSALHMLNGEGLYKSINNVYPPGRFIALSIFFKMLGTSVPTSSFYFILLPTLFFPSFLFFFSYKLFTKYKSQLLSFALATLATLIYLFFIYSAQDVHVFAALFFIVLLSNFRSEHTKNIILGILLGIVFLFRIEAGIFLLLSIAVTLFNERRELKKLASALLGFLAVWIPVLIFFILTGSLRNFISDTLYPGLIVQPKLIDLPITSSLGYVFIAILIFLFSTALSLYIKFPNQTGIRIFALFSVLSFAGALVRSDEGHLWYGAVWLPVYISYVVSQLNNFKKIFKPKFLLLIILVSLTFFAIGYFIIEFKSSSIFIIITFIIFWLFTIKYKSDYSLLILISGVAASLVVFHSLSFIRLRFTGLPIVSFKNTFSNGLFSSEANEIHGLKFDKTDMNTLKKIREKLDTKNKWLFIYPDHVLLYDYFKLKNPTRYYYFAIRLTSEMETEIIKDLEKTRTNNFILFPNEETNQISIKKWILKNTFVDQVFMFGDERIELRKKSL